MFYKNILLAFALLVSGNAMAGNLDCGIKTLTKVYVQADRVSSTQHRNKMLIGFDGCTGASLGYLDNTDPAFAGMLSIALAAYMAEKPVKILLDDAYDASGAKRIQYLLLQ